MEILQIIILALIQGVTEFLPVSSSAHLILPAQLLGWPDQGLAFDVAVHVGSLMAVLLYFRSDVMRIVSAWLGSYAGFRATPANYEDSQLAWKVLVATLPAVFVALLAGDLIETHLRSAIVIAIATLFFGVLLGVAELTARKRSASGVSPATLTWFIALAIGFAQVFALIPGTSRSGVTMTMAIILGLSRSDSARFSFLLSMPIILAAGSYSALELFQGEAAVNWFELLLGVFVSAVSAWLCIALFMRLIERIGMMPFVYYRLLLGLLLLFVFYA